MSDWLYKATSTKLDYTGTLRLLNRGFLCRSAYNVDLAWIANVQAVLFGDVLHCYFIERQVRSMGAYEVIRREYFKVDKPEPSANDFAGPVPGCALYEVVDPAFIRALDPRGGYEPDPKLNVFTGWLLQRRGPAVAPPAKFLSETPTLVRRA